MMNPNALTDAAYFGHSEIVTLLLANGADPNTPDGYGCRALQRAACKGHSEIVALLLAKGADPGMNPKALTDAAYNGHSEVVALLKNHVPKPSEPQSLQFLTRTDIRARLVERLTDEGQPLKAAIKTLPLPTQVKQYVFNPLTL